MPATTWLFSISCMAVLAGQPAAAETAPATNIALAPHQAVYELTLEHTGAGSNVTDIRGELVYEFSGSVCQGYTLNTRLVTEIFDREGKPSVTDIRSESFEDASGGKFHFTTSQYLNNKLSESTKGTASAPPSEPGCGSC